MFNISPSKVIRGKNVWKDSLSYIKQISSSPLILGKSSATKYIRKKLSNDLAENNLKVTCEELHYDCCDEDLNRVEQILKSNNSDSIIAAGGGKVLDAGKLLADRLSIPCITIPLSASTCAGWTALSNIYTKEGKFIKDVSLKSCPNLLIFDHSFIKTAPKKTLASGIADALAKWYESSLTSSASNDGIVQQAIQISRVLRDQLLINGQEAFLTKDDFNISWCNTIEACALTAGLIGGIGGEKCRTAAAHAIHNSITQLEPKKKPLHGEIVGVGILIQLKLEEELNKNKLASQSILQLTKFMKSLDLPTTISELGINVFENDNLEKISNFACKEDSEIHFLPFSIKPKEVSKIISRYENQKIKT